MKSPDILDELRKARFRPYLSKVVSVEERIRNMKSLTRNYRGKVVALGDHDLVLFSSGKSRIKYEDIVHIAEAPPTRPLR